MFSSTTAAPLNSCPAAVGYQSGALRLGHGRWPRHVLDRRDDLCRIDGSGTLTVRNGGVSPLSPVTSASQRRDRDSNGRRDWFVLDDQQRSLVVGDAGSGTLTVRNGGTVNSMDTWIGYAAAAPERPRSRQRITWECNGDLSLGRSRQRRRTSDHLRRRHGLRRRCPRTAARPAG